MRSSVFSERFKRDKLRLYDTGKMSICPTIPTYNIIETALCNCIDRFRSIPTSERIASMERLIGNQ